MTDPCLPNRARKRSTIRHRPVVQLTARAERPTSMWTVTLLGLIATVAGCGGGPGATGPTAASRPTVVASIRSGGVMDVETPSGLRTMGSLRVSAAAPAATPAASEEETEEIGETWTPIPDRSRTTVALVAWGDYVFAQRPLPTLLVLDVAQDVDWWEDVEPVVREFVLMGRRSARLRLSVSASGASVDIPLAMDSLMDPQTIVPASAGEWRVWTSGRLWGKATFQYRKHVATESDGASLRALAAAISDDLRRDRCRVVRFVRDWPERGPLSTRTMVELLEQLLPPRGSPRGYVDPFGW